MVKTLLLFLLTTLSLTAEVPVLNEGRVKPFSLLAKEFTKHINTEKQSPQEFLIDAHLTGFDTVKTTPQFLLSKELAKYFNSSEHLSYNELTKLLSSSNKAAALLIWTNSGYDVTKDGSGLIVNAPPDGALFSNLSGGEKIEKPKIPRISKRSKELQGLIKNMNSLKLWSSSAPLLPPKTSTGAWSSLKEPNRRAAYKVNIAAAPAVILEDLHAKYRGSKLAIPSERQLKAEVILSEIAWNKALILLYALACFTLLYTRTATKPFGIIALALAFSIHTAVIALRCYVLERPPVSNMGETLIYVPWIALLVSIFSKNRRLMGTASGIASALLFILFLSGMGGLEKIQPVLNSQLWLSIHVLMVVGSYGAFILAGVLAHLGLIKPKWNLEKPLIQCIYIGTALLVVGTILGGVWAAQSWGRFWDWDPKESWAFISSCTYLALIHAYRFKKIAAKGLAIGSIIGLMVITFTWYGVNYILGTGLHSYGFGNGGEWVYYAYLVLEVLFIQKILAKSKRTLYE